MDMNTEDFEDTIDGNLRRLVTDIIPADEFESFGKSYLEQVSVNCTLPITMNYNNNFINSNSKTFACFKGQITHFEQKQVLHRPIFLRWHFWKTHGYPRS